MNKKIKRFLSGKIGGLIILAMGISSVISKEFTCREAPALYGEDAVAVGVLLILFGVGLLINDFCMKRKNK